MSRPIIQMQNYASALVGKTVKAVRSVSKEEMDDMMWFESSNPTCVIEFTDDTYAVVMSDPEGNGTGFLDIGKYQNQVMEKDKTLKLLDDALIGMTGRELVSSSEITDLPLDIRLHLLTEEVAKPLTV